MNHLETGVSNVTTTADAAIPAPIGPASNAGLVWNGSSWVAATIVNANVSSSAAIAYSKLNLAGGVVNNDVSNSAAIAYSKLNLATSILNADVSASAAIAQSKLASPYVALAQITANVTGISGTTFGTGTTIISVTATFDGNPVWLEFYSPAVRNSTADTNTNFSLSESSTELGIIAQKTSIAVSIGDALYARYRFTPSAASHTYSIVAYVASGTAVVQAGAGGVGVVTPTYLGFTRA